MTTYQHHLIQLYTTSSIDGERHRKPIDELERRMNELGANGFKYTETTDYWVIMTKTIDEPTDTQINEIARMTQTPRFYIEASEPFLPFEQLHPVDASEGDDNEIRLR